jgi:DNA-binding beta-propeller fold protein YncE
MRKVLILLILSFSYSCVREVNPIFIDSGESYLSGEGVFVLNEGNFRSGNGSLSFFSYDSLKIYNHVFLNVNQRPLGDIPYYMDFHGNNAYIVVNNSGKIEVADRNNLQSVATINGIISPRYISFINDTKAYFTSLYSDSLAIIDLTTNSVSGYINLKKTSESIVTIYSTAYVANWTGGNKIMVINTAKDQLTDSIEVGIEPESMVIDKNETLWVLCNGGWKRDNYAELIGISTRTNKIEKRFIFPSRTDSPTCLHINGKGEVLYFLLNGVRRMAIEAQSLPSQALIPEMDHVFYKLGVNPGNEEIFVTDAVDYVKKGKVLRYSKGGALISEMEADIIPGNMCFKINPGNTSE